MFTIYTIEKCPGCAKAEMLLKMKQADFEKKVLGRDEMKAMGFRSAPQVFLNSEQLGGYQALREHFAHAPVV